MSPRKTADCSCPDRQYECPEQGFHGNRHSYGDASSKAGQGWGKIAHDMGLNLGKIVSAARRSSKMTLENAENAGKPSLIPPPGIRQDSILFTGITPVPSATVSRGVNPVPSTTMKPRP